MANLPILLPPASGESLAEKNYMQGHLLLPIRPSGGAEG
jgi:hypothetical protein